MKGKFKWYIVLILSSLSLVSYIVYMFTDIGNGTEYSGEYSNKLPIPPILEDINSNESIAEFKLNIKKGQKEFFKGKLTDTYGYNGNYLGPTIRVKKGDRVNINIKNFLDEPTTVHWHGLEVPGEMDGGPHQDILPDTEWNPIFTINQGAATLWYHPHLLHKTGEHVYKGLAGLFIIDDDISKKLNIPDEYGVNDIPLIIQDRRFTKDGYMPYDITMRDIMHGMYGNTILVNGAITPYLNVKNTKVRFRVLNGSNARTYELYLDNGGEFYQLASDGGFLEKPIKMDKLTLAPAERAEIIVDFSKYSIGESISLIGDGDHIMSFNVTNKGNDKTEIPDKLTTIEKIPLPENPVIRKFEFRGMGPMVNINGKQMNMDRIDEEIDYNVGEIWEITNETMGMMGGMIHPFHVHGTQFQIIERNGEIPPENERGFKDTVLVRSGEIVKVIVRFKYKGTFMYHCHILEHEDAGMMGQILVR